MDDEVPPRLQVQLLGELSITCGGVRVRFPTKKSASLFAALLLQRGRPLTRERLISILWPDYDEAKGRHNLDTTLWRVRRALRGRAITETSSGALRLVPEAEVDLLLFYDALAEARSGRADRRQECLEAAHRLYVGDLAETLSEEYFEEERNNARNGYMQVLRELAAYYAGSGLYDLAVARLVEVVQMEPLNEDSQRELMRAYYLNGQPEAALTQFEALKHTLNTELGAVPSAASVELREYIAQASRWSLRQHHDTRAPQLSASGFPPELPLVGRSREAGTLVQRLDLALAGRGSCVLICGDLGVGKTRLVRAVIDEARLRGFDVLSATCPELEVAPPYSVLLQALWPRVKRRALLSDQVGTIIDRLAAEGSSPEYLDDLERVSPRSIDGSILDEYLLRLLLDPQGPASRRPATLLVIEDIHRVDGATERVLVALVNRLHERRLFVLLSLRQEERESERIRTSLVVAGAEPLELHSLSRDNVSNFLQTVLGHASFLGQLSDYAYRHTGGVPLFLVELLKFLFEEGFLRRRPLGGGFTLEKAVLTGGAARVPSRVLEIIRRRMNRLSSGARTLLTTAAVVGPSVSYEMLEQLLGIPEDELIETVENLVVSKLLSDDGKVLSFPHESLRLAALSLQSRGRIRRLHRRVANLLERLTPSRVGEIGWHFSEAGEAETASKYFEIAGDRARQVRANEDAVRLYSSAIEHARAIQEGQVGLRRLAELLLKRQEVLDLTGDRTAQGEDILSVLRVARAVQDRSLLGKGLLLRSQVLSRMNKNGEALRLARTAESLFNRSGDITGGARAAEAVGLTYVNLRNREKAQEAFERSLRLFQEGGDKAGRARALINLGTTHALAGDSRAGIRYLNDAEQLLRDLGDPRGLARVLLQKGVLYRYLGRTAQSEGLLEAGIDLMREIGDRVGEARGRSQLACTKTALGKMREGLAEALLAIRLSRKASDTRAVIVSMNNAAYSNLRCLGEFKRAERYLDFVLRLVAEGGVAENPAIYYDTMSAIRLDQEDYAGALRWARQAQSLFKKWRGPFSYVADDIAYRMGVAYLRLGRPSRASRFLKQCVNSWRRRSDLGQLVHGVAALGELHLMRGAPRAALRCAREIERLLRRVQGVDQLQRVCLVQYKIYREVGARAAASRALARAQAAVAEQARTLKGRLRRQFIAVNRAVLEADNSKPSKAVPFGLGGLPEPHMSTAARIDRRRRAILALMRKGQLDQRAVAERFGVSLRTVRDDLAQLRRAQWVVAHQDATD
ncbi:MAG TPA: BTAD domain-containing putative transcriptional regulator [bacterium]|nr:BTAD domain-containing putative transcriptional regulator [bacterium]